MAGRSDHLELRVVLAQPVELALHLFVTHGESRQGDMQAVVARNRNDGPHLHDGVEGHGPAVLAAGDVDLRLGDGVELGVDDGAGVEVGQRLA